MPAIVDAVGAPAVVIAVCEKAMGGENSSQIRIRLPPRVVNFFIICRIGTGGELERDCVTVGV
jgi:hypothetical protein